MKWYTGEQCQVDYANEMVAILGPSGKQATANKAALSQLPWTTKELEQVQLQFNNLASVPNYPGAYIIDRYTNFAFLSAYNDNADPSDSLMAYINIINKEIARKRDEFGLETLSDGVIDHKDLLTKRLSQLEYLVERLEEHPEFDSDCEALVAVIKSAIKSDDKAELNEAVAKTLALYKKLDPKGEIYVADRNAVMGYDMTDATLTKGQKNKVRKCHSYEVYKNSDELVTLLFCTAEFLQDAADCTAE